MLIGVPRELKNHEYRVAITPAGVHELTRRGHQVVLEHDAGARLDDDLVAVVDELLRARRGQRDPVFVRLDLLGDADPHGGATLHR